MATSLHGWQLKPISLSPLACLLAWRVPTGSQRVPKGLQKGTPKWPKIDQKSTRAALGMPKGVRGYPPGASEAPNMHFYAYLCIFCAYLCIFMHILCIFMHVFISLMHIYTYCCTCNLFLCIFMHIYAFSGMFMNVYVIGIFGTYLYTSVFFTHVCTYSHISIHEKTLICCQWKIMQPGYTPQGIEYLQVRSI